MSTFKKNKTKSIQTPTETFETVRQDFPVLQKQCYGKRYAFLDSAASSLKPKSVIETMSDFLLNDYANIQRGLYHDSLKATVRFEDARTFIGSFLGLDAETDMLVFTRGATEAINVVVDGILKPHVGAGDVILLTVMEHHANIVPWQMLAKRTGARLRYMPIENDGTLNIESFKTICEKEKPRVVAFTYVSNVLGTINPVQTLTRIAKGVGAWVLVDGVQGALHLPLRFCDVGADFMVVSSHKMLGPTGVGGLLTRRSILEDAEPYQFGGEMIRHVGLESSTWNEVPHKFEAGTPPIAEVLGWETACRYIEALGWDTIRAHEKGLLKKAFEMLSSDPRVTVYGPKDMDQRSGVVSFNVDGIHPHDVGTVLDKEGVAVRAGHHCAQVLMRVLNVPAAVRASFCMYNNSDDIDQLKMGLDRLYQVFRR